MEIDLRTSFRSLSEYINREIHPAILHAITLLIPVNIYVIGDWLGAGVRWPLFRYQETYLGRGVISILMDGGYAFQGILGWKTALATWIWIAGISLLVLALIIALLIGRESLGHIRGYFLISGTVLLLLSVVIQYGFLFHGPAGLVIPIGIPVLLTLGIMISKGELHMSERTIGSPDGQVLEE